MEVKITKIVYVFSIVIFLSLLLGSIFVHPVYQPDYIIFQKQTIKNLMAMVFLTIMLSCFSALTKNIKVNKLIYSLAILLSLSVQVGLVFLLPKAPFSDMKIVYEFSTLVNEDGWKSVLVSEYLSHYPNNIFFVWIIWLVQKITVFSVYIPKIMNIIFTILTTIVGYEIYKKMFKKDNLLVLLLLALFPASLFYVNHVYSDSINTFILTFSLWYFISKEKNLINTFVLGVLIGIGCVLRQTGILFFMAIFVYLVTKPKKDKLVKVFLLSLGLLLVVILFIKVTEKTAGHQLFSQSYPVWSFINIGLNPKTVGFQDGSHDMTRSFFDIKQRLDYLKFSGLMSLIIRKIFWIFMEGTYQLQRYGIGYPGDVSFYYKTFLEDIVLKPEIVRLINLFSYLLNFVLTLCLWIYLCCSKKKHNYTYLFLLIILINLFFYSIWEIKSRYLYSFYPLLVILASGGITIIHEKIHKMFRGKKQHWLV